MTASTPVSKLDVLELLERVKALSDLSVTKLQPTKKHRPLDRQRETATKQETRNGGGNRQKGTATREMEAAAAEN